MSVTQSFLIHFGASPDVSAYQPPHGTLSAACPAHPRAQPKVAVPLALSLTFSVSPAQLRHALVFRRTPPL